MGWYKTAQAMRAIIKEVPRIDKIEVCPHCNKEIGEKEYFCDKNEKWFHRPCGKEIEREKSLPFEQVEKMLQEGSKNWGNMLEKLNKRITE